MGKGNLPAISWLWPCVLAVLSGCNSFSSSGRFATPPAVVTRVPFSLSDGLILVPGDVDGQHGYWLLDTGAPSLVVNTTQVLLQTSWDRTITVVGMYDKRSEQHLARVPTLRWGPFAVKDAGAISMDLHTLETSIHKAAPPALANLPLLGILGIAQIEPFVTTFDYRAKQLIFVLLDADGRPRAAIPGAPPTAQRDLVMVHGTPYVHATLQEEGVAFDALLAIDTGANGGLSLDVKRVERLGIEVDERQGDTVYRSVAVHGDTVAIKRGVLEAVFIGPVMYDTVNVTTRPDTGGTLGYRVLSTKRMALNIRARTLSLWN